MRSKISSTDTDLGGDDEVCKMIVDKFEQLGGGGVSYADIAKRAWEVGRAGLATKVGSTATRVRNTLLNTRVASGS